MTKWCFECLDTLKSSKTSSFSSQFEEIELKEMYDIQKEKSDLDLLEYIKNKEHSMTYSEVKRLARMYLEKYISQSGIKVEDRLDAEQLNWVYRLTLIPSKTLQVLINQFGPVQAKSNFRRLCILTHPDKNSHPLAANAFRKLIESGASQGGSKFSS